MQEEELLKWEIGTLTTRRRSFRALSRPETLLNQSFHCLLSLISRAPLQAAKVCVFHPFRTSITCRESQFSHLQTMKVRLSPKNSEIPTYTHLSEWQSCTSRALPERCPHEAIHRLAQFDRWRKKTTMNICLFSGLLQQRLPSRMSGFQAAGAMCLLDFVREIENPFKLNLQIGIVPA